MSKKLQKPNIYLVIMVLILTTLACGSLQVGVLTPTSMEENQHVSENQEPETELVVIQEDKSQTQVESELQGEEVVLDIPGPVIVTAWLGHVASLPEDSQYDDMVALSPKGTGEFGLIGKTPEIEAVIRSLQDADGPNEFAHLWGDLSCDVDDYNNCQLVVEKLQYGANYAEEDVAEWIGTIKASTFNGGQTHVFELRGDYPMWYGIWASQDEVLQERIESLRDTGAVVQVSGKLLVGIPDVNGTRIEVSSIEILEPGTNEQRILEDTFDPTADWSAFINDRYDYQIRYPIEAIISLFGPEGFSPDDVPEGMTPDQYMDSLLKEYTNQLCVKIEYSLGWIYIAAPPNMDKFLTPCGPTGLGAGEIISKIETIRIGDLLYQANGTEFKLHLAGSDGNPVTGESLDLHGEMYRLELEDGTVIRFGSQPQHSATYEDYLMKTRDVLLQIIATFQILP